MNIAFQALAILALVLPGIILKNSYRGGFFWNRPRQVLPITEEIAYSLLFAGAVHTIFASFVHRFIWPIDFGAVVLVLLGQFGKESVELPRAVASLTQHPIRIFLYFAAVNILSAALGYLAHWVVRSNRLDVRWGLFRFDHYWHYLLSGEIAYFPESSITVESEIDFVSAACVVDTASGSYLYVGVLDSFFFDRAGNLDLLVLTGAMRRLIGQRAETDVATRTDYFFIDADFLYLKYSDVKNISIRYIRTIEQPESAA